MKKKILLGSISVIASIILSGCGGSDSNSSSTSSTETGYFIDSAVAGVEYTTSSGLTGTTDEYGRFRFNSGDTVRFSIGKLELGDAIPSSDGLVTPEDLAAGDETVKTTILRVLQALDIDDDPTNGITIPSDVVSALEESLSSEISITSLESDSDIISLDATLAEELDEDYDGVIDVTPVQAEQHFEQSISMWHNGYRPDDNTQGQGGSNGHSQDQNHTVFDINNYPVTENISQELKDALSHMGNEERLAYDVYMNLYNYHATNNSVEIQQLYNIADRSEKTHVGIVQSVVQRYNLDADDLTNVETPLADNTIAFEDLPSGQYDIPAIQELYDALYEKGILSQQDALEVGCMVEVTDINDLDEYIAIAEESDATDVVEAFKVLRSGSYNHYWAFDKGLKNLGIEEGCCSLGDEWCHSEYPQNENQDSHTTTDTQGSNQGQGNQHGRR